MFTYARRFLRLDWRFLALAAVLHYGLTWLAYGLTEAPDSKLIEPVNYWYYWWVTNLTIGYGDLSPQSEAARLIAPLAMGSGVGLITLALGKIIATVTDLIDKRRKGLMATHATKHILVLGDYHPVQTRTLIANVIRERQDDHWEEAATIVGCFANTGDRNPFTRASDYHGVLPHYIQAGEGGINRAAIEDAGALRASQIYIACETDATAIGIVCLLSQVRPKARIVLLLREHESVDMVPDCSLDLSIITPVQALLATREMEDAGTAAAIIDLLEAGGSSFYSLSFPGSAVATAYEQVQQSFTKEFGSSAILIGFSRKNGRGWIPKMNPAPDTLVESTDRLLYIAEHELSPEHEQRLRTAVMA